MILSPLLSRQVVLWSTRCRFSWNYSHLPWTRFWLSYNRARISKYHTRFPISFFRCWTSESPVDASVYLAPFGHLRLSTPRFLPSDNESPAADPFWASHSSFSTVSIPPLGIESAESFPFWDTIPRGLDSSRSTLSIRILLRGVHISQQRQPRFDSRVQTRFPTARLGWMCNRADTWDSFLGVKGARGCSPCKRHGSNISLYEAPEEWIYKWDIVALWKYRPDGVERPLLLLLKKMRIQNFRKDFPRWWFRLTFFPRSSMIPFDTFHDDQL